MPVVGELVRRVVQPLASSHRLLIYTVTSAVALAAVILNALRNYSNFYSVAIYLSRSSRSVLVLANFGFLTALVCGRILQKIFFGPLLPAEVERLYDRIWYFVTESLLAFTMFRDEFDLTFGLMFGFLLFIKCFHWLMSDRIEWMDQRPYPGPPPLFHIRILSLFTLLSIVDAIMFMVAVESTLNYGVGVTVLFANEYAILTATAWNAMAKYGLSIYELRRASTRGGANAPPWEAKSQLVFYIELVTDFFKLTTYLIFFMLIMSVYGLPLNIVRDVYMTGHSFVTRLYAFHRYRTATRDMNERYPNATEVELSQMSDRTCIICREDLALVGADGAEHAQEEGPNMTPKKLPCGHIFHFQCLRSWLERQQNCPTCRRTVLEANGPQGERNQQGQQAPPVGGLAPAPQRPAGQARPWGLFAQEQAAGAAQAGQQPAQGGIGGWIGRFLGAAAQPPLVPGQFGNGPPAQQPEGPAPPLPGAAPAPRPRNPGGAGAGQHPPALVFEYNYVHDQNQGPRLMQPPMLQGFYREDGLWQGWPIQGRQGTPTQPALPRNGTGVQTPSTANASSSQVTHTGSSAEPTSSSQDPRPAPAVTTVTEPILPAAPSSSEQPATPVAADRPATPRDAAALAAMRRVASTPGNGNAGQKSASPAPADGATTVRPTTETPKTTDDTAPTVVTPTLPVANSSTPTSLPAPPVQSSTPLSTSRTVPAAPGVPAENRITLPSVIPLYDFGRANSSRVGTPSTPSISTSMPLTRALNQQHRPYNGRNAASLMSHLSSRASLQNQLRPSYSRAASSGPIHTLPHRMSEEELHMMDRLTRDAIDERIRVLEGVNGAVNRCLEELLRLRSVLPPVAAGQPSVGQSQSETSTNAHKGKGKEVSSAATTAVPDGQSTLDVSNASGSVTMDAASAPVLFPTSSSTTSEIAQGPVGSRATYPVHSGETSDNPALGTSVSDEPREQLTATVEPLTELSSIAAQDVSDALNTSSLEQPQIAGLDSHVPGVDGSPIVPTNRPQETPLAPLVDIESIGEDGQQGSEGNEAENLADQNIVTTVDDSHDG